MTTFLRFFVLALTPLLGVTGSLGAAFLFGLVATLLLGAVATVVVSTRETLGAPGQFWASLGTTVVLVTLIDLVTTLWVPGVRAAWGPYLILLAFSPLVVLMPLDRGLGALGFELGKALQTGLGLTVLLTGTAFVREALGHGTLTLAPGQLGWDIPGLKDYPGTILATGAGGFFLAAAGVVVYRFFAPRWGLTVGANTEIPSPPPSPPVTPAPRTPAPVARQSQAPATTTPTPPPVQKAPEPARAPASPEPMGEWGETLAGAVADLASSPGTSRRLLVIGAGNGELAYYLAMLCLDQAKTEKGFTFRVRGVDHFATRVETAQKGVYRDHQIDFIPLALRDAWLVRGEGEDRYLWRVKAEPRAHVQFEVADFQKGQVFFSQPSHIIVLNQGIEYVVDEKKVLLFKLVCDQLTPGGALVVPGSLKRDLLPEGMKRTGTTVFRKA